MTSSIKAWIYHNQKISIAIVVLVLVVLVLARAIFFSEMNASGEPDRIALVRSILDSLIAAILVTSVVSAGISWLRGPMSDHGSEVFIQSYQIDPCLRKAAEDANEWMYCGHTGRYVRSQIFPHISKLSTAKNEPKKIRTIILDPLNHKLCEFYATYRNDSRSGRKGKSAWTAQTVKNDLIASILCAIELRLGNSNLDVELGFLDRTSLFRIDLSSTMVLITQEDNQEPAIRYSSDSHFHKCYQREVDLAWRQCKQLKISNVQSKLELENLASVKACLTESGFDMTQFDDNVLKSAADLAKNKDSPYVSR